MKRNSRNLIAAGVAALAVTTGAVFIHIDAEWRGLQTRADRILATINAVDTSRPALWGETLPGRAWQAYQQAVADIKSIEAAADYTPSQQLDEEERDQLLAQCRSALERLHDGAHREDATYPIHWQRGFNDHIPNLLSHRALTNIAVLEAARRLDRDDSAGAVEILLDAMQFGRDMMHAPRLIDEMIGSALLAIASTEAATKTGLLSRSSPQAMRILADGLAILDENTEQTSWALHGEIVLLARHVVGPSGTNLNGSETDTALMAWPFGFSTRWMLADYAAEMEIHADAVRASAALPWPSRRAMLNDLQQQVTNSNNPMTRWLATTLESVTINRLDALARPRLLAMAVKHQRGQTIGRQADPFGGLLQHEVTADGLRVWSRGRDPRHRIEFALRPQPAAAGR